MTLQNQLDYLPTLLDGVVVPDGIDAEILKSNIMLEAGLRIPLYSEPETMADAITAWFASRAWTFEHLLNINNSEYSPIENVDRHDHWTRTIERALDRMDTGTNTRNETRNTESNVETSGEKTTQVAAYNTSAWDNSQKETQAGTTDGSEDVTATRAESLRNVADEDEDTTENYTQHLHGNIGITTNQDMITQELDLLERYNIYGWIAKQFAADLTLAIW